MALNTKAFQKIVLDYYREHGRHDMPWRQPELDGTYDAYKIMVSEIMLQQTQVSRVIPKYQVFITRFPTISELANASLSEVLRLWSGLGYNRRAKFLHLAARQVIEEYAGIVPATTTDLVNLPGVGKNTAGAIIAYAYNQPVTFIETNIRTVYIHHYFGDEQGVKEAELQKLVSQTMDKANPRQWYYALMDYGVFLKTTVGNLNKRSVTYAKQSKFQGSRRQIRGNVIELLGSSSLTYKNLSEAINDSRLDSVLDDLLQERLIQKKGTKYSL